MTPNKPLSKRLLEILILKSHGHTNPQIAKKYKISERTVRFYVSEINDRIRTTSPIDSYAFFLIKNDTNLLNASIEKYGPQVLDSEVITKYFTEISYNLADFDALTRQYKVEAIAYA